MTARKKLAPLSDSQEARIQAQIAADPDAPEATDAEIAGARPFADAFPALAESIKRGRGRPVSDNARVQVTLRLDRGVVEKFRATGKGWQTRMNDALKRAKV